MSVCASCRTTFICPPYPQRPKNAKNEREKSGGRSALSTVYPRTWPKKRKRKESIVTAKLGHASAAEACPRKRKEKRRKGKKKTRGPPSAQFGLAEPLAPIVRRAVVMPQLVLPAALPVELAAPHDEAGAHELAPVLDGHRHLVAVLEAPHVLGGAPRQLPLLRIRRRAVRRVASLHRRRRRPSLLPRVSGGAASSVCWSLLARGGRRAAGVVMAGRVSGRCRGGILRTPVFFPKAPCR